MEQFHCRTIELNLRISRELFAVELFFDDVKDVNREEKEIYAWSFGSKKNPNKEHAHLIVDCQIADSIIIIITYHHAELALEDVRPPYMEDCAQWLGGFVKAEKVIANLRLLYDFDESYAPKVNLPFPLLNVMESSELTGATVTGVAIRFNPPSEIDRVILERFAKNTVISIYSVQELGLMEFDIEEKLQQLNPLIESLVRERESA